MSQYILGPWVNMYLKERMDRWKSQLSTQRDHLFNYIVFLRVTPFLPNWFVNIAAPHLRVPLKAFYLGTWVGVLPPSFVHVQAGRSLQELDSLSGLATWGNLAAMAVFAVLSLLPVLLKRFKPGWMQRQPVQDEDVFAGDELLLPSHHVEHSL